MKTELKFKGIEVKSECTHLETLLILEDYDSEIEKYKAELLSFFKDKGYADEEIIITVNITASYIYVYALNSSGNKEYRFDNYTLRYTDSTYTKERNEKGLAAKAEAETLRIKKAEAAKAEAETLRIKKEEAAEAEAESILLCRKKTWIEQNGSEELKLLLEFNKGYSSLLETEFVKSLNIPNFDKIGGIGHGQSVYTPKSDLLQLAKRLKQAGYTVTDFSEYHVEVTVEVFGKKIRVRCRPTA